MKSYELRLIISESETESGVIPIYRSWTSLPKELVILTKIDLSWAVCPTYDDI